MAVYIDQTRPNSRPTLNLDFANSRSVDNRIIFTRNSSATYYNERGVLQTVRNDQSRIDHDPSTGECKGLLVEEQRTNLLTYSEDFTNADWFIANLLVVPNSGISPNGTMTADKIIPDTSNTYHLIQDYGVTTSGSATMSIFAKAAGYNRISLRESNITGNGALFDLSTGIVVTTNNATATITAVGNGWYRCTATITWGTSYAWGAFVGNNAASTVFPTFAGNNTDGVLIWGAQLESGSFATSYIPSSVSFTSRASSATYFDKDGVLRIAGINQPRYGYGYDSVNGKWLNQGLILEAATTNQFLSSNLGNWVLQGGVTRSINSAIGPDGLLSATTITTNSEYLGLYSVSLAYSGTTFYTTSIFVKAGSTSTIYGGFSNNFEGASAYYFFNLSSKTITTGSVGGFTNSFAKMIDVGNGWYRLVVTAKTGEPGFNSSSSIGAFWRNATAGTAYYYGVQFETGSVDSSYIPTYGSSVTRAADVSSSSTTTRALESAYLINENFYPWWNNLEHSFYAEASQFPPSDYGRLLDVSNNSTQRFSMYRQGGIGTNGINSQFQITGDSWSTNTFAKFACAISTSGMSSSFNGNLQTISATYIPYIANRLNIGGQTDGNGIWNGHIKKISFYDRRITNSQLQALTKQ